MAADEAAKKCLGTRSGDERRQRRQRPLRGQDFLGTEARVRIMRLLLSAHPDGLVVGDIHAELDIPNSTLSHHLDKLRHEDLVTVEREGTFLRYAANAETLGEVLGFWYAEYCTRNQAVNPRAVVWTGKQPRRG